MKKLILICMLTLISIPLRTYYVGVPFHVARELRLIQDTIEWCKDEKITRDMNARKHKILETLVCTN